MVTIGKIGGRDETLITELCGLSSDTKPIGNGLKNGSLFYEINTTKYYIYNETSQNWNEINVLSSNNSSNGNSSVNNDNIETFYSTNDKLKNYITTAQSTYPSDSTSTIIGDYRIDLTSDEYKPNGYVINGLNGGTFCIIDETNGQSYAENFEGSSYTVYNLIPQHIYKYFIIKDNQTVKMGRLKDTSTIRTIHLYGSSSNWRDLGGWQGDGGKLKYGLLFRGECAHGDRGARITDKDVATLKDFFRIDTEVDMRWTDDFVGVTEESPIGKGVKYNKFLLKDGYYTYFNLSATDLTTPKNIIETIMTNVINDIPTYFHCSAGADRTGTVASILEGVCGVVKTDIDIDYELSSFSSSQLRNRCGDSIFGKAWVKWTNYINTLGESNPWVDWCLNIGINVALINQFRQKMIDGTPTPITVEVEEVDNLLSLSIDADGSKYGTNGYKENYRISSSMTETAVNATEQICLTGYLPISLGDTLEFSGMNIASNDTFEGYSSVYYRVYLYDSMFNLLGQGSQDERLNRTQNSPIIDGDYIKQVTINYIGSSYDISNVAYIRFTFKKNGTPIIKKL